MVDKAKMKSAREKLEDLAYGYWRTGDGRVIAVKDMTDAHLIKSILRIKFSPVLWRKEQLPTMERELARRNIKEVDFNGIIERDNARHQDGYSVPAKDGKSN